MEKHSSGLDGLLLQPWGLELEPECRSTMTHLPPAQPIYLIILPTLPNVSPSFQNHHVWPGSLSSLSINRDVVSWLFVFPISVRFQGKPFNIIVMQAYAPTSNAEEAEQFYEDLQDLFRTNIQKRCPFHYRGLECKSRKSRNTWSNRQIWPQNTE